MKRRYSKSLGRRTHANPDAPVSTLGEEESLERLDALKEDPFILLLDQVQDPRNLGACLRSADGVGVNLVVLPSDCTWRTRIRPSLFIPSEFYS